MTMLSPGSCKGKGQRELHDPSGGQGSEGAQWGVRLRPPSRMCLPASRWQGTLVWSSAETPSECLQTPTTRWG